MLARLRLHPFVRRHDEQHDADAAQAGKGVVEEALMPGNVDEADLEVALDKVGEADVDRDAARLLLGPAIAIDPGQRLDQARLAVVDVAGCADNDSMHSNRRAQPAGFASTSRASRLIVEPSAEEPKRASISFMIGPIAAGPDSPRASTTSWIAARICPSSTWVGRYAASILASDSSFASNSGRPPALYCAAASSRCLIALRTRETNPASSTSPMRRIFSFLISLSSMRRVDSFSFSPAFMAAFTSASMRCCGVVVMEGIIGGKGAPARRMTLSPGEASAPDARHCRRPGCACRVPRTLSFEPRASRDHGRIRPRSRRGSRESPRSRGRRRQAGSVRQPWWSYYSPNSSSGVTRCGVESPSRSGVCSTLMRKKSLSEGSSLTDTLVRRYTYGNFNNLPIFGPEADFLLGIPVRQRELVSLARAQVLEQKRVTKAVLESNVSAAASICRELSIQTEHLEQAIAGGAAAVALAIEDLGDRIS